jgi:5-methyltetrahydrofolate--homocysteine methyltransferase
MRFWRVPGRGSADIVGLSGLITPSLEDMQYVAAEMQDDHFRIRKIAADRRRDLSRVHTAVKVPRTTEGRGLCA